MISDKKSERVKIEYYDKASQKTKFEKRSYNLRLSETEIGVLKAALHYYQMSENFGNHWWYVGGGSASTGDYWFKFICGGIHEVLDRLSDVKPNYGYWGSIEHLGK